MKEKRRFEWMRNPHVQFILLLLSALVFGLSMDKISEAWGDFESVDTMLVAALISVTAYRSYRYQRWQERTTWKLTFSRKGRVLTIYILMMWAISLFAGIFAIFSALELLLNLIDAVP
jgi:hypothetical protein